VHTNSAVSHVISYSVADAIADTITHTIADTDTYTITHTIAESVTHAVTYSVHGELERTKGGRCGMLRGCEWGQGA
jgi:hypothetical protein